MIEELRSHSAVAHVEEDQVVSISNACHSQSGSIWNLDRINKKEISQVDGTYKWDQDASEIDVYIVDTYVVLPPHPTRHLFVVLGLSGAELLVPPPAQWHPNQPHRVWRPCHLGCQLR